MKAPASLFIKLYALVALGILLLQLFSSPFFTLYAILKALLMPLLLMYFWQSSANWNRRTRLAVVFALLMSWLGDVLLLGSSDLNFQLGLGAFLLAHLGYIRFFSKQTGESSFVFSKPFYAVPIIVYAGALLFILLPHLGPMKIPVMFYSLVIGAMGIMALNRHNGVGAQNFRWVLLGATLFILSDSCIAINKFLVDIPYEGFWIMLSYMAAQYLIVRGALFPSEPAAS